MKKVIHTRKVLFNRFFWVIMNVLLILPAISARAESTSEFSNPLVSKNITELVESIADIIFKIGIPVATVFIIYSGLMFVTARGSEEQLKKAKSTFMWTVLGAAVLLGAKVIAMAIKETVKGF